MISDARNSQTIVWSGAANWASFIHSICVCDMQSMQQQKKTTKWILRNETEIYKKNKRKSTKRKATKQQQKMTVKTCEHEEKKSPKKLTSTEHNTQVYTCLKISLKSLTLCGVASSDDINQLWSRHYFFYYFYSSLHLSVWRLFFHFGLVFIES